ncbi:hypothetical protein LWI29_023404 [Acer saccharum]|uniref:NTP pyrophosphohydrolase MazG putative catalytic core domain-containing protein n=1 Tax=Acer saccharum TaxID=4024 RepID=A0AA39TUT9_ACESA|nr:hypothetical protein LWI29_023404 [Acer saccharum]
MMFEEAFQAKVDDPRSFVIPISVGGSELLKGMLDLRASINMMPLALYEKLGLVGLEPTRKKLMLADRTSRAPHREIKDIPILVDGIMVPTDFVVLNIEEKSNDVARWQVLLGRPFMATAQMKINVGEVGELSEIFQWKGEVPRGLPGWKEEEKQHVGEELSDVLLYLVRLSDICGVNLDQAVLRKLELNATKYPAPLKPQQDQ